MKKQSVLIIDDEQDFGLLMERYFSSKNFDVFVAMTITEGIKIFDEIHPDVVFLDNNLPDGFGWGKADYILQKHPTTKLHLISALDVPKTSASCFTILEKPLIWEELNKMFG